MRAMIFLCWVLAVGCTANVGKSDDRQVGDSKLMIRGEQDFERQTKGLPIGIKRAEEIALDFQKRRYPDRNRVVIGPVVGFNGNEYLLTSPEKDGRFRYRGILVDASTGKVTLKEGDDGRLYKIAVWVHPFIWSGEK
jgi:hypothetical protein